MAKPPEPVDELLAEAERVVMAEVVEVVATGPKPARPAEGKVTLGPGASDVGTVASTQTVKLRVAEELKGTGPREVTVRKPEAPYTLHVGDHGPFFLTRGEIIGRYGPDTHRRETIVRALTQQGSPVRR